MRTVCSLLAIQLLLVSQAWATKIDESVEAAARDGKYTYLMFYREDNAATRQMASAIDRQVSRTSERTSWLRINVADRSAAAIVKRYDATRLPMPTVLGIAPNGAVTCVCQLKASQEQLDNAILTPRYCEMVKALQEQKITVVCLQPADSELVPAGVTQLAQDSNLKNYVVHISASASDLSEGRFFERMRVKTDIKEPVVLMFAPPGVHLGTFSANVSGQELAKTIHKSGKCSCKHCQKK
jgi:hypothetical protein